MDRRDLGQVLELARLGLGQLARLVGPELHGGVAVAIGGPQAGDGVRLDLQDETATIVPSSWKTWVMPTLRPINPMSDRLITS